MNQTDNGASGIPTRKLGSFSVGAIGLGAMLLSREGGPDERSAIRTLHVALDAGLTLIDTADTYCTNCSDVGHNERLVAKAVHSWSGSRDEIVIATKGGHCRSADGGWHLDGRPEHLRRACEASLIALGVDVITLYQHHRPDPKVPYEDSVGALKDLQDEGKIRFVGIGNASVTQIAQAMEIVGVTSVQNEFSPSFRTSLEEIEFCATRGVAFLAWAPLGGMAGAGTLGSRHPAFEEVARRRGVSAHQICLAWELATAPTVIPIPGARKPQTILDSLRAADLKLDPEEIAFLNANGPAASPLPARSPGRNPERSAADLLSGRNVAGGSGRRTAGFRSSRASS